MASGLLAILVINIQILCQLPIVCVWPNPWREQNLQYIKTNVNYFNKEKIHILEKWAYIYGIVRLEKGLKNHDHLTQHSYNPAELQDKCLRARF